MQFFNIDPRWLFVRHFRSSFSYSVTRAYPFPWFTPVAIIGGIIATCLVSFLNIAATGYELVPASSPDPIAIESNSGLSFAKWPSYLVGARAACQSTSIQVQNTMYTDKTAFPYTLTKVWQLDQDNNRNYQGSLIYKSYPLQMCNITEMTILFEGPDRTAGQISLASMGGTITAITECYIDTGDPKDRTYFEVVATYDAIPPSSSATSLFLSLNKTENVSMYWGYSLLGMYWRTLMQVFFDADILRDPPFSKGIISMRRNSSLPGTIEDQYRSLDFLSIEACFFVPVNSTGIAFLQNRYCNTSSIAELAGSPDNAFERPVPSIGRWVNDLGKAMWSTILADLGRNDDALPNMLARPDLLQIASADLTTANQTLRPQFRWGIHELIYKQSFDPSQSQGVQLQVNQSVLVGDYLCQVPQLKSPGTLFVSVLVADLAILQAIWMIFTLLVDRFFVKDSEEASSCATCTPVQERRETSSGYKSVMEHEPEVILLEGRRSLNI
ncbi:hypothetical protein F4677DRAFT_413623 [Hypoxylon crocopeplum]|nr:hypothetical protein F4677DRAFT_413623 [Hypoxylon crocopeplum]